MAISNNVTVLLSGNTAGTNAFVAQNLILVGGNNVTLSGDPRGSVVVVAGSFNTTMATGAFAPLVHTHSQYLTTAQPPGSYLTTAAQTTARSNAWSLLGVIIQSDSYSTGVVYSDWLAGSTGFWAWVSVT